MALANLPDPKSALRDAATTIVLRDDAVLMGQRGAKAAFMPGKFVFPGGAVDKEDANVPLESLDPALKSTLSEDSTLKPEAIIAAAIRELWEETGQLLGTKGSWTDPPENWRSFAETGHVPNAAPCRLFFRAITPKGRPRRFDARFILVDANDLVSNLDDFSASEDELSHIQWVPLKEARKFDLPFITEVVLAEIAAYRKRGEIAPPPFFRNDNERHLITRLGGKSPLD